MEQAVTWQRARGFRIAHAFADMDPVMESERSERVEPVAHCGWWLIADLHSDDHAERCRACTATVNR